MTTARAARLAASRAPSRPRRSRGPPSGLVARVQRPRRPGSPPAPATGVAAITLAHQRQRGEGSDPVGVSSRTKPMQGQGREHGRRLVPADVAGGGQRTRAGPAARRHEVRRVTPVAVSDRPMPSSSQPTGWRWAAAATTAPTVAALTTARTGMATPGTNWTRSGRPAWRSSWSSHGDRGQAEQAQQPQRPRQPGRPPARPARSGGRRHRHGPGCSQHITGPATSYSRQLPVWPACVWTALRRTDRPRLARGSYQ